jgi:hypothetical protein
MELLFDLVGGREMEYNFTCDDCVCKKCNNEKCKPHILYDDDNYIECINNNPVLDCIWFEE